MKLTFEQIKSITVGATRICEENGGICFRRFSREQENVFFDIIKYLRTSSGIKFRFKTNSESLFLKAKVKRGSEARSFFAVDVKINGKLSDSYTNFDEKSLDKIYAEKEYNISDFKKEFLLGKGEKEVEIHLPYSVEFILCDFFLDDNAFFEPIKREKILMAYGDSITHGYDALHPSKKYVTRLCDALNAEEYNRGIGGACFCPELVSKKDEIVPDYITVAYGTNDFCCGNKEMLRKNCRSFFENLVRNYDNTPIFALAPIWASHATKNDVFGEFSDIGKIIEEETSKFGNVIFIDCFDFVPHNGDYFGDGRLHPNDKGFKLYFKALHSKIIEYIK